MNDMSWPSGVTRQLAQGVAGITFADLTPAAVQTTKTVLLDSIGCALGAGLTERSKIALEMGAAFGSGQEGTAIGNGRYSTTASAFVNGELINCTDFDIIGPLKSHAAPYVLPPSLAIGEKIGANGRDLLTALAISLEISGRVTGSISGHKWPIDEPPYYVDAPRCSNSGSIFGGVAGAAWLLKLSEEKIRSAMGIGGISTPIPGNIKYLHLEEGNNVNLKYGCWTGWVALLGTVAVLSAQKGFRGDLTILDGQYGYWQMYGSPYFHQEVVLKDLGKVWRVEETNFKYYPACYANNAGMLGIHMIVQENNLKPEDIEEITVYGDPKLLTPNQWPETIKTNEDAMFSGAYLFAKAACYKGPPGPEWQVPAAWEDPQVARLMPKVKVKSHPNLEKLIGPLLKSGFQGVLRASVAEVKAKGKTYTKEVPAPKGHKDNPMTVQEFEAKFRHNASYSSIPQKNVDKIIDMIWNIEKLGNAQELMALLHGTPSAQVS